MKNKKLFASFIGLVFLLAFFVNISNASIPDISPKTSQGSTPDGLISINFTIYINGNWSETVALYDWATGSGTEEDPYIIEGIHVTNENQTAHISIENAEYFIIRNVTVSNYAKPYGHHIFAGIYIGNGRFGLIDSVTIINASHGISLSNGLNLGDITDTIKITNSRFIGSHNDTDTGLGAAILIHGTRFGYNVTTNVKNVNVSYNDIYNFYDGIVVYDAEEIYIENNRIETTFGHVSDTGIYFYRVNDSTIINNDLYGTKFSGHEYEELKTSSGGFSIGLVDSYNITVYGNRFYDLQGNLIGGILISIPPNYSIFIILGVVIIVVVVSVVLIIKKKVNLNK